MTDHRDLRERCFSAELPPDLPRRRSYRVLSPRPGKDASAILMSDAPVFTVTHYQDNTTYACLRDPVSFAPGECVFCRATLSPRTQAWLCGLDDADGKQALVQVTWNAVLENPRLRQKNASLRGKRIVLHRRGKAKNSPVYATIEECYQRTILDRLPPPFDIREALLAMWEIPAKIVNVQTGEVCEVDNSHFFTEEVA